MISYHIMLYNINSYCIIWYYITLYIILCYVMLYYIILCYIILYIYIIIYVYIYYIVYTYIYIYISYISYKLTKWFWVCLKNAPKPQFMAFFLQKRVIKFGHTVAYFQTPPFMFSTSEMGIQLLNQGSHDRSTVNPFLIHCYVLRFFISSSSEPSDMADLCKHETISRAQNQPIRGRRSSRPPQMLERKFGSQPSATRTNFVLLSLWPHMVLAQGDLPIVSSIRPFNKFLHHRGHHRILAPKSSAMSTYVNICQTMCHAASIHGIHGSRRVPQRCVPLPLQLWVFCAQDSLQAPRCRWQNWKQKTTVVRHGATLLALRCFLPHHSLSISKGISSGTCLKISVSENRVPKNNHNSSTFYY